MPREVYTPSLPDKIKEAVGQVESRAKRRLLKPEHLERVLAALRDSPAGRAVADGGAVPNSYRHRAETTKLAVYWYTWRGGGGKVVDWAVNRDAAPHVPWGRGPTCEITTGPEGREAAYATVFPDRYKRFRHLKCLRRLRPLGVAVPAGTLTEVRDVSERFRLATVKTRESAYWFLCTPVGCFRLSSWKPTVPEAVREVTGRGLPRTGKSGWVEIEPLFVMVALAK